MRIAKHSVISFLRCRSKRSDLFGRGENAGCRAALRQQWSLYFAPVAGKPDHGL